MAIAQPERVLQAVRMTPLFRGLSSDDQGRIASVGTIRDYTRGDRLWSEGDPSESLTVIVRGRVKIVKEGESSDVILEIFGEGEPVGAIAV